ncbi:MAG: helix-turn-helix domain-containing protein, partial [Treponema sp.]|nr:helix-turn-helix domain-containing protein [Treponema sp.]
AAEYIAILGNSWSRTQDADANPLLIYFLFGEIIVSASKIAESLGGDIREIVPFSLDHDAIQRIIGSPEAFSGAVKSLLAALIEFRDSHTGGRYQSVIVKAREYIDSNFASAGISLYSTAAYVGISPNHLSAVFAQETGENFIDYLTRVRIEKAKQLLRDTAMKSADIAYEAGFSDPHYFSSIFKKNTGLSPREFRLGGK